MLRGECYFGKSTKILLSGGMEISHTVYKKNGTVQYAARIYTQRSLLGVTYAWNGTTLSARDFPGNPRKKFGYVDSVTRKSKTDHTYDQNCVTINVRTIC